MEVDFVMTVLTTGSMGICRTQQLIFALPTAVILTAVPL